MRSSIDRIKNSMTTGPREGFTNWDWPKICWCDNIMSWIDLSGTNLLCAMRDRWHWMAVFHTCTLPLQVTTA